MQDKASSDLRPAEVVVLVHGLWTGGWVWALQARRLARCGFRPVMFSYDSMRCGLTEAARELERFAASLAERPIHFVAHSLGGLVVLRMLEQAPSQRVGRIVLLGTPYAPSLVAQRLGHASWGRMLLGLAMQEWLAREPAAPGGRELGVLAGCRTVGMGRLVANFESANDGVVAVAETRVPGMADFVLLRVAHTEMLWSREVARQTCQFLQSGRFAQVSPSPCPSAT